MGTLLVNSELTMIKILLGNGNLTKAEEQPQKISVVMEIQEQSTAQHTKQENLAEHYNSMGQMIMLVQLIQKVLAMDQFPHGLRAEPNHPMPVLQSGQLLLMEH